MATRKILSVGVELASSEPTLTTFRSKTSLLDWDMFLFRPEISEFLHNYYQTYQGKPCFNDTASFEAKECCEHWRREIKQAVEAGKTVVVFLPPLYEAYVDTGTRSYSGTGRNQNTTRHVELLTNYDTLPIRVSPVSATGTSMKLASKGAEVLVTYWSEFGEKSSYKVVLESNEVAAHVQTRVGDKPVGTIVRSKSSAGTLLLLPDMDFNPPNFTKRKGESEVWTPAAIQFAGAFLSSIVALDKALRSSSEVTPEPPWANHVLYTLAPESALRAQLLDTEREVEEAQRKKEIIVEEIASAALPRALLYEKSKPLETAIIHALKVIGFKAEPFKDSDSEFDVVFESEEGRLIGEAEGKDAKAVNIDKLRQLSMNIHEDLQREEVSQPAKPVLFGNGFRLQEPATRPDPFTEKCHAAASTSSTALVATADLFSPVQYLLAHNDLTFAAACRAVILSTAGRVTFPCPPIAAQSINDDIESEPGDV